MKTYAIITYSKIHYLLDDKQHEELQNKHLDDILEVDGSSVKVRNIADILTLAKYYEAYPDKRPQLTDRYKELPGIGMSGMINISREKALVGIISGLLGYLSSAEENPIKDHHGNKHWYQGGAASKELLKLAQNRLATII